MFNQLKFKVMNKKSLEKFNLIVNYVNENLHEDLKPWFKTLCRAFLEAELERENSKRVKAGLNMYDFIDKTNLKRALRPQFCGVFHENGLKIATTGSVLVSVCETYDEANEGKIIAKNGQIIEERFPNWRYVVPKCLEHYDSIELSKNDIKNALYAFKIEHSINKELHAINIETENYVISFNAKNIELLYKFMLGTGLETAYLSKDKRTLFFKDNDTIGLFLALPYNVDKTPITIKAKKLETANK